MTELETEAQFLRERIAFAIRERDALRHQIAADTARLREIQQEMRKR